MANPLNIHPTVRHADLTSRIRGFAQAKIHPLGLLALSVVGVASLTGALMTHGAAKASRAETAVFIANHPAGADTMLPAPIDHSVVGNSNVLPEPRASLRNSEPNAYASLNLVELRAAVTDIRKFPDPYPPIAAASP